MPETDTDTDRDAQLARLADALMRSGLTIAVAESLTCGMLALRLGAGESPSTWLRGGVVAYSEDVKFSVLGVTPGPVITASCAEEMAQGVARVLGADLGIGVTGVGGPGEEEGHPAGTVFIAVSFRGATAVSPHSFGGEPQQVMEQAVDAAVAAAVAMVRQLQ